MKPISVTTALSVLDHGFGDIPYHIMQEAARIGKETHRFCLGWIASDGALFGAAPDISPFVDKFIKWFESTVQEVFMIEGKPAVEVYVTHPSGYAGHIDLIAKIKGDRTFSIIDLKRTAMISKFVGLQLAGYQYAAEAQFNRVFKRRFALHIPKEGPCKAVEFNKIADRIHFLNALQLYKYLKEG